MIKIAGEAEDFEAEVSNATDEDTLYQLLQSPYLTPEIAYNITNKLFNIASSIDIKRLTSYIFDNSLFCLKYPEEASQILRTNGKKIIYEAKTLDDLSFIDENFYYLLKYINKEHIAASSNLLELIRKLKYRPISNEFSHFVNEAKESVSFNQKNDNYFYEDAEEIIKKVKDPNFNCFGLVRLQEQLSTASFEMITVLKAAEKNPTLTKSDSNWVFSYYCKTFFNRLVKEITSEEDLEFLDRHSDAFDDMDAHSLNSNSAILLLRHCARLDYKPDSESFQRIIILASSFLSSYENSELMEYLYQLRS